MPGISPNRRHVTTSSAQTDIVTLQNTSLVEQSSAAAESLDIQARRLQKAVASVTAELRLERKAGPDRARRLRSTGSRRGSRT
jgi:hypothetical protein